MWMNSVIICPETLFVLEAIRGDGNRNSAWQHPDRLAGLNWDLVLQESLRLGVAPLVGDFLVEHHSQSAPPFILSNFQDFVRRNSVHNLKMTAELARIKQLCETQGILLIPFKGPTLTDLLYQDLSRRVFGDLDVWVEKHHVLAVSQLLDELGYVADLEWQASGNEVFLQTCYQMQFINAKTDVMIELHWGFWPKYLAQEFSAELVKNNLIETRPGGKNLPTLNPELLLLYLCLHGAKHPWETLGQIVDVARLIHRFPALDWSWVVAQARTLRVERMLWLGVLLARDLVGVQLPWEIERTISQDRTVIGLAQTAANWLFGGQSGPQNKPQAMIYHFRLQQGFLGRLQYLWRLVAVPTYSDWKMIRLPIEMLAVYPLLRPFRILKKLARPF